MEDRKEITVAFGCDHAGFDRKEAVMEFLNAAGYTVLDFGAFSTESVDYPYFAHEVANAIEQGLASWGVLVCGSGNGVAITANKHAGIRAALCWKKELGALAHQHNNANIIALPGRFISDAEAVEILTSYIETSFEGGRHERRIEQIPLCN